MRISVVGTGYVGLVSAVCFAEIGHDCICIDIDETKVVKINSGEAPIHEVGLESMLKRWAGSRLRATTDLADAVAETDVTFIAVGTPFDGNSIDLDFIEQASRQIGTALASKDRFHTVIVKSTVVPGTTDEVVIPILEEASGKRAGIDFGVGMNPEFLTEGTAVADFMVPDRIVLGGGDERTIDVQKEIYASFGGTPVVAVNNKTAEMIKYTSNAVLATLISFSNEVANMCAAFGGVDVADVMRGVHLARYLSPRLEDGTRVSAPINSFLWAGCGYGGSCLPKDTKALSAHSRAHGYPTPVLDAVIQTNENQPARMIALLDKHFESLEGMAVSVLGLAFKEDTDDVRESPAFAIIEALEKAGAKVTAYDPIAWSAAEHRLSSQVQRAESLRSAVENADAVMLVTRWAEFDEIPSIMQSIQDPPLLIDGRRILGPDSVARYDGIGR